MLTSRGFSLIEILVAVSIVAIITVLTVPNLRQFNDDQGYKSAVGEFAQEIRKAQVNSQSRVICDPLTNSPSDYWGIRLLNKNRYQLLTHCNVIGSPDLVVVGKVLKSGLMFGSTTPGVNLQCPNGEVDMIFQNQFNITEFEAGCGSKNKLAGERKLVIQVIKGVNPADPVYAEITVESGGAVNVDYNDRGQSLLEITMALGVAAAIIVAITAITIQGLSDSTQAQTQVQATKLAQEGIEQVRSYRNLNTPVCQSGTPITWVGSTNSLFATNTNGICGGTACYYKMGSTACAGSGAKLLNATPTSTSWEAIPVTAPIFYRGIKIEDYVEAGGVRLNQKKVTVTVKWMDNRGDHSSELITILSNY